MKLASSSSGPLAADVVDAHGIPAAACLACVTSAVHVAHGGPVPVVVGVVPAPALHQEGSAEGEKGPGNGGDPRKKKKLEKSGKKLGEKHNDTNA